MRLSTSSLFTIVTLTVAVCLPGATYGQTKIDISLTDVNRPSTIAAQRILNAAYRKLGIQANFVALPATRGKSMWDAGKMDAVAVKVIDNGLQDAVKVNVPIVVEEAVVFSTEKDFTVAGFDSLKPYVVGYVHGIIYLDDRLKDIPQKETAPNLESLFRKLEAGRTDVAVDSRFAFCLVRKLGLNHIRILEPSLEKRLGYHFLHARHRQLVPALENVLRDMERDGSIKKMQDEAAQEYMAQCTELSEDKRKKAAG